MNSFTSTEIFVFGNTHTKIEMSGQIGLKCGCCSNSQKEGSHEAECKPHRLHLLPPSQYCRSNSADSDQTAPSGAV